MDAEKLESLKTSITDPITMAVMEDPYSITVCNHTFDKQTIDDWVAAGNNTCMVCRVQFTPDQIKPNFAMRDTIANVLPLIEQMEQQQQLEQVNAAEAAADENDAKENNPEELAEEAVDEADGKVDENALPVDENPSLRLVAYDNRILIEVVNPESTKESPGDIVLCIDVSGSMRTTVTRKDENGNDVNDGLTILDIVKHSAMTLIQRMTEVDRLSIVTFENSAIEQMPLTVMNEEGMQLAERTIKSLRAGGGTNLWAGMEMSLDVLKKSYAGRNSVAFVLTDGQPTSRPTRGFVGALSKYRESNPTFSCNMNTIGFGYNLDSELLDNIARFMNGSTYSFVPDGMMVGTIFIHLGSNSAVTSATNGKLSLEFENPEDLQHVVDDIEWTNINECYKWEKVGSKELSITLGNMSYGQNRSVVIPGVPISSVAVTFTNLKTHEDENMFIDGPEIVEATEHEQVEALKAQLFRQMLVATIRKAMVKMGMNDQDGAQELIRETHTKMSGMDVHGGSECADIVKDLTGQISEAFSKTEWYQRWGRHYLPSLACAHMSQVCNNFKDPGVQHLGGKLFEKVRDGLDDMFNNLPDPEPSGAPSSYVGGAYVSKASSSYVPSVPGVSLMSAYNNASAGCIRGDCLVEMADGKMKRVDEIVAGDRIKSNSVHENGEPFHEVQAVVVSKCPNGKASFVGIGRLAITPWHPVFVDGKWQFPVDLAGENMFIDRCEFVYNFVLESGHVMTIEGVPCVTLGHGFEDNSCIKHEYFGTNKVIDDLRKVNGYSSGRVMLAEKNPIVRDEETGRVVAFNFAV